MHHSEANHVPAILENLKKEIFSEEEVAYRRRNLAASLARRCVAFPAHLHRAPLRASSIRILVNGAWGSKAKVKRKKAKSSQRQAKPLRGWPFGHRPHHPLRDGSHHASAAWCLEISGGQPAERATASSPGQAERSPG